MVDVGEKHDKPLNQDLVKKFRVEGFGYPSLAVPGKDGTLLCTQSTGVFEKGTGYDLKKILYFLRLQAAEE